MTDHRSERNSLLYGLLFVLAIVGWSMMPEEIRFITGLCLIAGLTFSLIWLYILGAGVNLIQMCSEILDAAEEEREDSDE